jgi:hypothetical protein
MMYRVNCGFLPTAKTFYPAKQVAGWLPDQALGAGCAWGADGGSTVVREPLLPIRSTDVPDLYRTERFGMKGYEFPAPNGTYTVTLHFAETCENNVQERARVFDVSVNGRRVLEKFDPFREAGRFAAPVVMECAGQTVTDGKLRIGFTAIEENPIINAIEVRPASAPPSVRKISKVYSRAAAAPNVPAGQKPVRILFIGNSMTLFWQMPSNLETMINGSQSGISIKSESCIAGGKGLTYHYEEGNALERIREGRFDCVVLQGWPPDKLVEYIRKFDAAIRESGARTLLYCTWEPPMIEEYTRAAGLFKLPLAPAGQAWAAARKERSSGMELLGADGFHPGLLGAYLTACVFYAVLTGQNPEGRVAPSFPLHEIEIEPETALFLQRVAWRTVKQYEQTADPSGRFVRPEKNQGR